MPNNTPLSKSITLPEGQLTKKKTPSLLFYQSKRHSNDKLPSRNFSISFMPKVPRHSQDIECDLFTSSDQSNAREIENFKHDHLKQRQIHEIVGATKSDGYGRRILSRQQPHVTVESEKKKLQTEEDKLGNRHTYPDHMVNGKVWYKELWMKGKRQAKKIANSIADADSSSDESISDEKQMTFHKSQIKHVGDFKQGHHKQPKIQAIVVATKSGGYKSQIMKRKQPHATVEYEKKKLQTEEDKLGNHHTYQDHMVNEKVWYKYLWRKLKKQAKKIANSNVDEDSSSYKSINFDYLGTTRPSDYTRNKLAKRFASNENSAFQSSKGDEVNIESQKRDAYKIDLAVQTSVILESDCVYTYSLIPPVSSNASIPEQISVLPKDVRRNFISRPISKESENRNNQERCITQGNENGDVAENYRENVEHLVTSQNLDMLTTQDQIEDENRNNEERCITLGSEKESGDREEEEVAENHRENEATSQSVDMTTTKDQIQEANMNNEEGCITLGSEKESEDKEEEEVAENHQENEENLGTSQTSDTYPTQDQIQEAVIEEIRLTVKQILSDARGHKSNEASEDSANQSIHDANICSTFNSQEDSSTGMPGSMVDENWCKVQAEQIPSSEANTDISSNESMSAVESTRIELYRNVIRNETYRMMSSIDMVVSEAEHLFGLERSWILFEILTTELYHFGSTRAISEFVPNMVLSTVRQNVSSFFEHASDTMNILMTLLLSCPDSNGLQQMPEQDFISVLKPIIQSLLKTKTKGREKLSLEENNYTMVDPKEFERALGVEIPEDVLIRLKSGDEMVVHTRFVDTRQERHQPSHRRENRQYHSIYFPSDCRLFIYIPTENGNYWHQLDMRRADRTSQHSR